MRQTPLRTRSQKLARLQRVYSKLRREFLTEHAWCIRCGRESEQVHHAAGRVGADLLRVEAWRPVCGDCHMYITEHPAESIERGWSLPRIGAAS